MKKLNFFLSTVGVLSISMASAQAQTRMRCYLNTEDTRCGDVEFIVPGPGQKDVFTIWPACPQLAFQVTNEDVRHTVFILGAPDQRVAGRIDPDQATFLTLGSRLPDTFTLVHQMRASQPGHYHAVMADCFEQ